MWLPKDERKVLAFYYQKTDAGSKNYSYKETIELINSLSINKKTAKSPQITTQTVEVINRTLRNRGLINIDIIPSPIAEMIVGLTPEGIRLGQKYNSWWSCSNLWYEEHIKNHWIWIIVSFLGGVIGGLLINWMSKGNQVKDKFSGKFIVLDGPGRGGLRI